MKKEIIEQHIDKLIVRNDKAGDKNALISIIALIIFLVGLSILSFFVTTKQYLGPIRGLALLLFVAISSIFLFYAIVRDKTTETGEKFEQAKHINNYWISKNKVNPEYYKYINPVDSSLSDLALDFLHDSFGIER